MSLRNDEVDTDILVLISRERAEAVEQFAERVKDELKGGEFDNRTTACKCGAPHRDYADAYHMAIEVVDRELQQTGNTE